MTNGRVCGWILLVGAFLSAVADVAAQALIGKSGVLSAVDVLDILAPDFLDRLIIFVRDGIHPLAWDPLLITILTLPGWLLTGIPGVALVWRFRTRPIGDDEKELPHTTYEDLAEAASEEAKLQSREPSKYEGFQEYDPTDARIDPDDLAIFSTISRSAHNVENITGIDYDPWSYVTNEQTGLSFDQDAENLPTELGERDVAGATGQASVSEGRPVNESEIQGDPDPRP